MGWNQIVRGTMFSLILLSAVIGACSKTNSPNAAGSSGAGSGGSVGSSGSGGSKGRAGSGGSGGASGMGGRSESGGNGGASGMAGIGGQAGSGGSNGCAMACGDSRDCCVDHCVNPQNDRHNCGACAERCAADEYCEAGKCVTPPCSASCNGAGTCCGTECCGPGKLCCDPQGPIQAGPTCLDPNEHGACPLGCAPLCRCTAPETPIATPSGERPIASLRTGDVVYSIDRGRLVTVPIVGTSRNAVSAHRVMRVRLRSGSVLEISPGHPTADGRRFETLVAGDSLDGVEILEVDIVPYRDEATYDILPDSDTAAYFAGGVLIGSTLAQSPTLVAAPTAPFDASDGAEASF